VILPVDIFRCENNLSVLTLEDARAMVVVLPQILSRGSELV